MIVRWERILGAALRVAIEKREAMDYVSELLGWGPVPCLITTEAKSRDLELDDVTSPPISRAGDVLGRQWRGLPRRLSAPSHELTLGYGWLRVHGLRRMMPATSR